MAKIADGGKTKRHKEWGDNKNVTKNQKNASRHSMNKQFSTHLICLNNK